MQSTLRPPGQAGSECRKTRCRPACSPRKSRFLPSAGPWSLAASAQALQPDRKSVVEGKSVSVRVYLGGRRIFKKTRQVRVSDTNSVSDNLGEITHNTTISHTR